MKAFASVIVSLGIGVPTATVLTLRFGLVGMAALLPAVIAFAVADANDRQTLRQVQRISARRPSKAPFRR